MRILPVLLTLLCLNSCATHRPAVSNDVLPEGFEVSVGGFFGPSYSVILEDDHLLYSASKSGGRKPNTRRVYPTDEQWMTFWAAVEKVDIEMWSWLPDYEPESPVSDGTQWRVAMKYKEKSITSHGNNGYPSEANPRKVFGEGPVSSLRFSRFTKAVSNLLGGLPFD